MIGENHFLAVVLIVRTNFENNKPKDKTIIRLDPRVLPELTDVLAEAYKAITTAL